VLINTRVCICVNDTIAIVYHWLFAILISYKLDVNRVNIYQNKEPNNYTYYSTISKSFTMRSIHKNEIIAQEIDFINVFLAKGYILTRIMRRLFSHY
jgi:hypothetical protein